ncbi:diguanylate cyclase (GGDEF)-like protein/PAS domain S-box-containing protein [Novosphingobium chloroacetimidivorans]|uniref:Diguanylate cyclase (GGDEF)-like protein/PAS domain S-box-containing protein n=1 Tax=Novosphingobium chloroacetimidivorans TaxID=1428314 RepID=A0A7W7K8P1_9SPHN|nr:sensor domain-containing diguanylate cyclase [Novosphingobium chloroacetimidivorans]MBB4858030.1 diguanylate cyclase (GGDEF)-like protein/PAS domain S-box-containing protein [Novosphingobium chloroacetimidivorans]
MKGKADQGRSKSETGIRLGLIAALGYCLLATVTIEVSSSGHEHATVWPADALILALLLKSPRSAWPTILLCGWMGNLLANVIGRGPSAGVVLYGAINMAQALVAACLIVRSLSNRRDFLGDTKASGQFLLFAGLLAPGLGAGAGSLVSLVAYDVPFGESFLRWFASNAIGLLIGTPIMLAILDGSYGRCFGAKTALQRSETLALITAHGLLTAAVFSQTSYPLLFLPLSSLLLVAFRLGRLGTFAGVAIVACAGATATYLGIGPVALITEGPVFQSLYFQIYIGVILCTALPVAATVSSRADALVELAEHRKALQQILANAPEGILSFDETGTCRWADGRLKELTGVEPYAFVGCTLKEVASLTSRALLQFADEAVHDAGRAITCDFSPDCTPERTLEASVGIVSQGERRTGMVITMRDISARKSREAAITRMAETDDLTRVLNRKGFRTRLSEALDNSDGPLTLALIDVDRFKSINDTFGHAVGDRVLEAVAQRLQAGTRNTDYVGRLGGDEFAILFGCDVATAQAACERIAEHLRVALEVDANGSRVVASISCGVAQRQPGMTRSHLFDAADTALYEVKRAGRDGVRVAA